VLESRRIKSLSYAGFLGSEYGPFSNTDPSFRLDSVSDHPRDVALKRFEARNSYFKELANKSEIMGKRKAILPARHPYAVSMEHL